jgi:hypothetical protein
MPAPNPVRELIQRQLKENTPQGLFHDRVELYEPFNQRPVLASTLDPSTINQAAVRLLTGANKDWIISGTNAALAGSSLAVDGGIKLDTAGADNDQIILSPATAINSVAQSAWNTVEWEPEHELLLEFLIELPSLADVLLHAGLGLTAALDLTTDDDQAKFQFSDEGSTSTSNFTAATSIGGTDAEADTDTAPEADKTIRLGITTSSSRVPRFFVNGVKVHTGDALTSGANLIPFVGIQALTGSAKTLYVRGIRCSRVLNDA